MEESVSEPIKPMDPSADQASAAPGSVSEPVKQPGPSEATSPAAGEPSAENTAPSPSDAARTLDGGANVIPLRGETALVPAPPEPTRWPRVGEKDERGNTIKYIYGIDPDYMVYYSRLEYTGAEAAARHRLPGRISLLRRDGTDPGYEREGVQVQLSPDPDKRKTQRAALLSLGSNRAKLQALLSGWPRRESYDSSVATALQLALDDGDGKAQEASNTLADALTSIRAEREAAGRVQYAVSAVMAAVVLFALIQVAKHSGLSYWENFWLGSLAGLIGALLSIALGIRSRTVALDIYRMGNLCDSGLRLVVGAISGGALVLLFSTGLAPKLDGVDGPIDYSSSIPFILLVGMIGGFVERLVSGMLEAQGSRFAGGGTDTSSGVSFGAQPTGDQSGGNKVPKPA